MSVLAFLEQRGGEWNRMSWETLAAARQIGADLGRPVHAAVLGHEVAALAAEVRGAERVYAVEHPLLEEYTAEGYALAARQLITRSGAWLSLFPHSYRTRDFLPRLAAAMDRAAATDVIGHRAESGALVLVRQVFQGKMNADVRFAGEPPYFASLQAGAYRGETGGDAAPVETFAPQLAPGDIRSRPSAPFREAQRAVDLAAAGTIVAVGRGIGDADKLPLVERLAEALGAELAASRPICDAGWLPMERQVGSSGQTVAPKLYLAVGISGAIQHLVGMKGARTIAAINKDPEAPIFEVADYGIVGDLFQVVPALIEAIAKARGEAGD